ncbi:MAG: glycosyltransferase family 2 protein [Rhodomicrobium sp.]|jgi:glycosyltransferase involved in cell wall biosynthesis
MRIAACLNVLNEVELIERCILHLKKVGVDHILICDMFSTDGTEKIIEKYLSQDVSILRLGIETPSPEYYRKQSDAIRQLNADWVLFLDADEFVLPYNGNIRDCRILDDADVISLNCYNIACTADKSDIPDDLSPAAYQDINLIVQDVPNFRDQLSSADPLPIVRLVWPSKVLARPECVAQVTDGSHDVLPAAPNLRRRVAPDLIIAHAPMTTKARFLRKLRCIRETFVHHDEYFGENIAWHWRYWLGLQDKGEIDLEYERSIFSHNKLLQLRSLGVVKTASEMLSLPINSSPAP